MSTVWLSKWMLMFPLSLCVIFVSTPNSGGYDTATPMSLSLRRLFLTEGVPSRPALELPTVDLLFGVTELVCDESTQPLLSSRVVIRMQWNIFIECAFCISLYSRITATFTGPRQTSLFSKAARLAAPGATYCCHALSGNGLRHPQYIPTTNPIRMNRIGTGGPQPPMINQRTKQRQQDASIDMVTHAVACRKRLGLNLCG